MRFDSETIQKHVDISFDKVCVHKMEAGQSAHTNDHSMCCLAVCGERVRHKLCLNSPYISLVTTWTVSP
jgi:hypothetical protein